MNRVENALADLKAALSEIGIDKFALRLSSIDDAALLRYTMREPAPQEDLKHPSTQLTIMQTMQVNGIPITWPFRRETEVSRS